MRVPLSRRLFFAILKHSSFKPPLDELASTRFLWQHVVNTVHLSGSVHLVDLIYV